MKFITMSTQSIYAKTRETVKGDLEKDLMKQAKDFLLKKRFMLGKGVNRKKRNHALMVSSFICTENCDLIAFIETAIKGCKAEMEDNRDRMYRNAAYMSTRTYRYQPQEFYEKEVECQLGEDDCITWANKEW